MGKCRPIVKYRDCLPWAVQNGLTDRDSVLDVASRIGCTLAQPNEYDWTLHVRWRCGLMSNYFYHLFIHWPIGEGTRHSFYNPPTLPKFRRCSSHNVCPQNVTFECEFINFQLIIVHDFSTKYVANVCWFCVGDQGNRQMELGTARKPEVTG